MRMNLNYGKIYRMLFQRTNCAHQNLCFVALNINLQYVDMFDSVGTEHNVEWNADCMLLSAVLRNPKFEVVSLKTEILFGVVRPNIECNDIVDRIGT